MIRVKLTLNLAPIDAVEVFAHELPRTVEQVGRPILDGIAGPLLVDLQRYPPKPDYPIGKFPWKSAKQRRFVMMKLKGKRYRRKFGLRKAWRVQVISANGKLGIAVKDEADMAQFVVGKFNQKQRSEALKPVQPFHAPRWTPAIDTVAPHFRKADAQFAEAITQRYGDALRAKATRRSSFR